MMLRNILIIWVIGCLTACVHTPNRENKETILVDLNKQAACTDLFGNYRYVALETTDKNLIGKVDKVQIDSNNNRIYVMEHERYTVFVFDMQGKFINKIQRPGRGPEEYVSLEDFMAYKSNIYCLTRAGKINCYSKTGDFLRSYKLDNWYNNFVILNDSLMYLYSENSNDKNYNFILYDYKNDVYLEEFDPFPRNQSFLFRKTPFNQVGDSLLITKPFDLTVYYLDEKELTPKYFFSFNTPDEIPENYENMSAEILLQNLRGKSFVRRIEFITQVGNTVWCVYEIFYPDLGYRYHVSSYNLDTKMVKTLRLGDEIDTQVPYIFNPIAFYKDQLVSCVPAVAALGIAKSYSLDIFQNDSIRETDNPILFFTKLK